MWRSGCLVQVLGRYRLVAGNENSYRNGENCAAYVLESDAQKELAEKDETIRYLDSRLAEFEKQTGTRFAEMDRRVELCERARHYE